jgi:hypothetical protein
MSGKCGVNAPPSGAGRLAAGWDDTSRLMLLSTFTSNAGSSSTPWTSMPTSGKRACGQCSLCCKVMSVPDVTVYGDWCRHAAPGCGGCKIYRSRPEECREFHCVWLVDKKFGDHWRPDKCKIVIELKIRPEHIICFHVDPDYPMRWLEEPWSNDIKALALAGIQGRQGTKWITVVRIGDKHVTIGL